MISGSCTLAAGESVNVGGLTITAVSESVSLEMDDAQATILSGSVTFAGSGTVCIKDIELSGISDAAVDTDAATVTVPAGGTAEVGYREYANASSEDALVLTYDPVSRGFAATSGSYKLPKGETAELNGLTVSLPDQTADGFITIYTSGSFSVPEGMTFEYGNAAAGTQSHTAGTGGAVFAVSESAASFQSGRLVMTKGEYVNIDGYRFNAYGGSSEISRSEGITILVEGAFEFPAGAKMKVGGIMFTAVESPNKETTAILSYGSGTIMLTYGTVSVSGPFSLEAGSFDVSVTGSSALTTVGLTTGSGSDIVTMSVDDVVGCDFTVGGYTYSTTNASLKVQEAWSGTTGGNGTAGAKVVLTSGFVTMTSGSVLYVSKAAGGYLMFDQVGDRTVNVGIEGGGRALVDVISGSVNLTDEIDPEYQNVGSGTLSFFAGDSQNIELDTGSVSVPEGSTVKIGDRYVTNEHGTVTISSDGVVTVQPDSMAVVSNSQGDSYNIENNTSEPIERDVAREEREDGYSMFNEHRETLIRNVNEVDANTQAVRNLVEQTVASLQNAVYDTSMDSGRNIEVLDTIYETFQERFRAIYKSDQQLFEEYHETMLTELEKLHLGETSLTEKMIIDNLIGELGAIAYDDNLTLEENKALVDEVMSQANVQLSYYRVADSSSFNVYKSVMLEYISTQADGGLEEIGTLKAAYTESLNRLEYLSSQDRDRNLQRIDELIDGFDGAVLGAFITNFTNQKNTVLGNIVRLSAQYSEPEALEYIENARSRLENYSYDQSVTYQSNLSRVDDLYTNLQNNIGAAILANLNTFDDYCVKYHAKYVEVLDKYENDPTYHPEIPEDMREAIIAAIIEARDKVDVNGEERINYDHSLTLAENVGKIHKIASDLQEQIEYISSEDMRNELERTYAAALEHLAKNDKPTTPTKLLERIAEARNAIIAEYKSDHDVDDKGIAINGIMEQYNTDMAILIERAEFYLNIDVGCKFLRDKYETSQPVVVDRMNEILAEFAGDDTHPGFQYRENLTLEENLALLQQKVNDYSLELTNLKSTTNQGDFENYRDYVAWRVSGMAAGESAEVAAHVQTYVAKISALQYNGKSLYANKVAVDRVYDEFYDGYQRILFGEYCDILAANIEGTVTPADQDSVRSTASNGANELRNLRYRAGEYAECIGEADDLYNIVILRIGYARAALSDSLDFFIERRDAIQNTLTHQWDVTNEKNGANLQINQIITSDISQARKAADIAAIDYRFQDLMRFDAAFASVSDYIASQTTIDDSAKVRAVAEKYTQLLEDFAYHINLSVDGNIALVRALQEEFGTALLNQKYAENSTVTGGIRADGKAMDGTEADYPAGVDEVWGSVGNLSGLEAGVSVTMARTGAGNVHGGSSMPAEGNGFAVLGDGEVLGAFEVTLFKDGEKITDFNGTYRVRILLPEDMRGYDSMQVAYVDEYGDVQVYNAKVVGNYIEFYTTHFSAFTLIGFNDIPTYYDIYAYIAIAIVVLALAFYYVRLVRYDPNGGFGRTPAQLFFFDGEGPISENGFVRDGYMFCGWSRTRDGEAEFADRSELSGLGKIHAVKLYAVWKEEVN